MNQNQEIQSHEENAREAEIVKSFCSKVKNKINRKTLISGAIILVLLVVSMVAFANKGSDDKQTKEEKASQVEVAVVGDFNQAQTIEVVGVVKPETSIDVVALNSGNISEVLFFEGDDVVAGQLLTSLYDNVTLTNSSNSQIAYNNAYSSYLNTENSINDGVIQAGISLKNSEANLKVAKSKYDSALIIQDKNTQMTKNSAVASFNGFSNLIVSALDQIDYIIRAENGDQLAGINVTLAAKNRSSLNQAKSSYHIAKDDYQKLINQEITSDSIIYRMREIVDSLGSVEKNIEEVIAVLEATVPHTGFDINALIAQKTAFVNLRTSVINTYNSALSISTNLDNLDFYNQQESDGLKNALDSAQSQYDIAKVTLENARKGSDQQLIAAQSSLDGARGQLNLAQQQVANLSIQAPITGKIAKSYVEVGQEISQGQKIAQIYRDYLVKIEINLNSDDIYDVKLGQWATINGEHLGTVSMIAPSADPQTRKVAIEVIFDNMDKVLIPETFVDVSIEISDESNEDRIFVPLKTVTIEQGSRYLFIIEDGKVKKKIVETGEIVNNKIEILNGLNFDSQIVTSGQKNIVDGEIVNIK